MASVRMNDEKTNTVTVHVAGNTFTLEQDPNSLNHGMVLWDASIALARFFEHSGKLASMKDLRILELGAGTGLLSMVLAAAGADVVTTDLPDVCRLLQRNMSSHCGIHWMGTMQVIPYCWGDDIAPVLEAAKGPFDMIVGTDVAYSETLNPVLLDSAAAFARWVGAGTPPMADGQDSGGQGRRRRCNVLFANELRCAKAQAVFDEHAARLFDVKPIPSRHLHPDWREGAWMVFEMKVKGKAGGSG